MSRWRRTGPEDVGNWLGLARDGSDTGEFGDVPDEAEQAEQEKGATEGPEKGRTHGEVGRNGRRGGEEGTPEEGQVQAGGHQEHIGNLIREGRVSTGGRVGPVWDIPPPNKPFSDFNPSLPPGSAPLGNPSPAKGLSTRRTVGTANWRVRDCAPGKFPVGGFGPRGHSPQCSAIVGCCCLLAKVVG